jgi:hypothetical protein
MDTPDDIFGDEGNNEPYIIFEEPEDNERDIREIKIMNILCDYINKLTKQNLSNKFLERFLKKSICKYKIFEKKFTIYYDNNTKIFSTNNSFSFSLNELNGNLFIEDFNVFENEIIILNESKTYILYYF